MLTIRLTRKGRKNQPFFRVVVTDKRNSAKGGRPAEILGYIDPLTKRKSLKKDRILHWLKVGAKTSATVHNLLVSEGVIDGKKIAKHKVKPRSESAAPAAGGAAKAAEQPVSAATQSPQPAVETASKEVKAPEAAESQEAAKSEDKPT